MGRLSLLCPTRCNTDERGLGQTSGEGQGGGACCGRARVGTSGHEWARAGTSGHERAATTTARTHCNAHSPSRYSGMDYRGRLEERLYVHV